MEAMIKAKNSSYGEYEHLLLRRDKLKKEAFQYQIAYTNEFGDIILEIFQNKIECIRKRKTIEYCQAAANHGHFVDQTELQKYLKLEMEEFYRQLDNIIKETQNAKNSQIINEIDLLTIKKIYHRLVKLIHPDINPMIIQTPELFELWQRIQIAYNCNNKKEMQELEILVNDALKKLGNEILEIEITDIEDKIAEVKAEIASIINTDPYNYKYLLEDQKAVEEKKFDLNQELQEYKDYSKQLDKYLDNLKSNGVKFIWRMN